MYSINLASIEDATDILALQQLAYQSEAKLYQDWSLPPLTQTLDSLLDEFNRGLVLKAVINSQIIGSVRATTENSVCQINRLMVHPDFQGQGIGSALMKKIESLHNQSSGFRLFTGSKSLDNIRLYQKLGYTISHNQKLSDKVELCFMEKINHSFNSCQDLDPGAIYRQFFHPFKAAD
jgi:ribosomal protein S18 acetylase RimI-like enzyme